MRETGKQKIGWTGEHKAVLRLTVFAALAIFIVEAIAMSVIEQLPISKWSEVLCDSLLLVFLISPILFFFFFRPLFIQIRERMRTEEALKESEGNLHHISSRLMTIQEEERIRISRELHDALGQDLTLLKIRLSLMEKELLKDQTSLREECENIRQSIEQVIENVRRISKDLSPMMLEDCGLSAAMRHMANEFSRHYNINVSLEIDDIDHFFSQDMRIAIYRVFQEALTNIGKHSQATSVSASLREKNGRFYFSLEDNGKGFDPAPAEADTSKGLGMAIMKERVRMLGGKLDLHSREGGGTRISFSVPVGKEDIFGGSL
ncbi:MAG: sensor histidine kinase [Nitrospirae bacterium]|nr:sensor histidine kinase [Nitrospirota bacterium]